MKCILRGSIALFLALVFSAPYVAAQNGSHYDAVIQQGKTQLQAGSPNLALATGERAIKLNAKRWEGYALAGGALMNLKRYEQAADRFTDAIERAPQEKQSGLRELRRQCFAFESGVAPPTTASPAAPPAPASPTNPSAPEATTTQAEVVLWKSIENSTDPADFQTYLTQYPHGAFAALAQRHLDDAKAQAEIAKAQAQKAAWQNSGLADAEVVEIDGEKRAKLADGNFFKPKHRNPVPIFSFVKIDTFQGQPAIGFPATFFCREVLVYGQVDACEDGYIYVTNATIAYQTNKGKIKLMSRRTASSIKQEGGREGDTYSIYDQQGTRYRFGSQKFDSPAVMFLRMAISDFPDAYSGLQHVFATEQPEPAVSSGDSIGSGKKKRRKSLAGAIAAGQ